MIETLRPLLSTDAMRAADQHTIEQIGIPGFTLMETAGRESARHIEDYFALDDSDVIQIYCGKGNNGGDGLVIARWLVARGYRIRVILIEEELSHDAAQNLKILRDLEQNSADELRVVTFQSIRQIASFGDVTLHVDALLGTGLTSELRAPISDIVSWINELPAPSVAIDVPTGVHGDTGKIMGVATRAELTLTMGAQKAGLAIAKGKQHAGQTVVIDIGIPDYVLHEANREQTNAWLTTDAFVRALLPIRTSDAYKYSVGFALIVAGAPGMTGAPVMTSQAAARVGAGYVSCATPISAEETLATKLTEVTLHGLPVHTDEGIDPHTALDMLVDPLEKADAVAIGPGMGRASSTLTFVRNFLTQLDVPAVVDADGLFALSDKWLTEHGRPDLVLTPHEGEFSRLAPNADLTDRVATVREYADRWNVTLLLKGDPTLVAEPNGRTFAVSAGNAGLATAGTGDVLTGMTTGLLAQGLRPATAAAIGAHLGGRCAEAYAMHSDPRSMMATDVINELPNVLFDLQ